MADRWTIVCFSGIDWDSHRRRSHWLMATLADRGHTVLFVENLGTRLPRPSDAGRVFKRLRNWARPSRTTRGERSSITIDSPLVPPFQHLNFARSLAGRVLTRRIRKLVPLARPVIVWTYLPMPVVRDVAETLRADLLIFDWSDDASVHVLSKSRKLRGRIAGWEDEMVTDSDLVFVASPELLRRRGSNNPQTFLIPHGAPQTPMGSGSHPTEIDDLPRPRIGFVGSVNKWTDIELVDRMSQARPSWSFVMVGPIERSVDSLRSRNNVLFTGRRPHEEIPSLLREFDCGIIPYRLEPATEMASPLKLREYLEQGLPVVSVDIPDVRPFSPPVRIANGFPAFMDAIEEALTDGTSKGDDPAPGRSWDDCADEMTRHIEAVLQRGRK